MSQKSLIRNSLTPIGTADEMTTEINRTFVLEIDEKWTGTIEVNEYPELENFDWMLISGLIVSDEKRRKGYGSYLLTQALDEIKKHNCGAYLLVYEFNTPAIRLYEKFGFKRVLSFYSDGDPYEMRVMAYGNADQNQLRMVRFGT